MVSLPGTLSHTSQSALLALLGHQVLPCSAIKAGLVETPGCRDLRVLRVLVERLEHQVHPGLLGRKAALAWMGESGGTPGSPVRPALRESVSQGLKVIRAWMAEPGETLGFLVLRVFLDQPVPPALHR